ncbi:Dynein regulatory complex subunit 2 [Nowakowskiella sp. JEL0078]|nr:Dynein regulatory complex subunit 2 [Nowakowskiella sp. JEL0078]
MAKKGKKKEKGVKLEYQLLKDEESRKRLADQLKEKAKVVKSSQLRNQLSELQQIHERQLDRKNVLMQSLERDIAEAEEQYATAIQAHLINVDTLVDLQMERLSMMKDLFEGDKATLDFEFECERSKLQIQHVREKTDILGIMARMEQDFQETEADAKHEYSSMKDDVKNKNLEEKHALRIQLEGTVEDLWRQFQTVSKALNQYNSSTEERKKQFEELKYKDQKNAREIEIQMKKLMKLSESISHLKAKLVTNFREYEDRNKAMREEKEAIQVHFQELKFKMNAFRDAEKRKLTKLTILSQGVIKQLEEKVEMAEKIVKLAEMNRKLETEEERILPFYESSLKDEKYIESTNEIKTTTRFNKVNLDKLALEKQKKSLCEENEHLRSILKQYLDGISVNEEVLVQLNPLVVVNGKSE